MQTNRMAEIDRVTVNNPYYQRLNRQVQPWLVWLFALGTALGIGAILSLNIVSSSRVSVTLGEPSGERIVAPVARNYRSEIITERERALAAERVEPVFSEIDRGIGRQQINRTNDLFNFVKVVRADTLATPQWQSEALGAVATVSIDPATAQLLLALDAAQLESARVEAARVVGDLMRNPIRDTQMDRTRIADEVSRAIALGIDPQLEAALGSIVPQLIQPNSFFDEVATAEARQAARDVVEPHFESVSKDQVILREGEIVTAEDLEMLEQVGLLQPQNNYWQAALNLILGGIAAGLIFSYYVRGTGLRFRRRRYLVLLMLIVLLFTLAAELMVGAQSELAYLYPSVALALLVAVVFDGRSAALLTLVMGGIAGYAGNSSLEYAFLAIVGNIVAIFAIGNAQRINDFFRAGLIGALANLAVVALFNATPTSNPLELLRIAALVLAGGGLSASLTIAGFYLISSLFGITTMLQLQDLSRFDQPLLQELLHRAPGTYHHSIMVANLAEQAADRIGADSLLARVGAFYHDIGKMENPPYFTENQVDGANPHSVQPPGKSAQIIINHVLDGLRLARQHRLPERIQDFIAEHHGRNLVEFFYRKAVEQAAESGRVVGIVDKERYRYPGPAPRSRETAIVMMADGIEAFSKAVEPNNPKAIEQLVDNIIDKLMTTGQLNDSGLTLGEIRTCHESFIETLKGRYHVRVRYPGNEALVAANTPALEGELVAEPAALPAEAPVRTVPRS